MGKPSKLCLILLFGLGSGPNSVAEEVSQPKIPDFKTLEASGAIIGQIVLHKSNVVDTSLPEEDKSFYRLANRWANSLQSLGVKPGDRVALVLPQRPETAITHLGSFRTRNAAPSSAR